MSAFSRGLAAWGLACAAIAAGGITDRAARATEPVSQSGATIMVHLDGCSKSRTALNGTAKSKGATVTLPAALAIPSSSLIWSEVQYTYKPVIGHVVTGTLTLKDHIYMRPRMSDSVARTTS